MFVKGVWSFGGRLGGVLWKVVTGFGGRCWWDLRRCLGSCWMRKAPITIVIYTCKLHSKQKLIDSYHTYEAVCTFSDDREQN